MMDIWKKLEQSEKRLLIAAGLLTVLVVGYQFVFSPLLEQRDRARNGYALSLSTRADVRQMTSGFIQTNKPHSDQPLQAIVTDTASVFGLSINRLAPVDASNLNLWLEDSNSQAIYFWVLDLSQNHGVSVERALIRRGDNGLVSATLLVSKGQ